MGVCVGVAVSDRVVVCVTDGDLDTEVVIEGVRDGVGVIEGNGGSRFKRTDTPLKIILISVVHLIYIC